MPRPFGDQAGHEDVEGGVSISVSSSEIVEAGEEDNNILSRDPGDGASARSEQAAGVDSSIWSSSVEVAVAVGKGGSSAQALKWALDNEAVGRGGLLHLLHVQAPLRFIPSPMGNNIPLESVSEDVANNHKLQRFLATEQLLYQYKKMCDDRQVNSEVVYAEGDDIFKELVNQVSSLGVPKLIIGTSSQNRLTRALKKQSISSLVLKKAPDFCTVVVVCKGKVQVMREAVNSPSVTTST